MADDADRAQVINDRFQANTLAGVLNNQPSGVSRRLCANCEEPIPEARRKAIPGCTLCVSCQREQENENILDNWRTT